MRDPMVLYTLRVFLLFLVIFAVKIFEPAALQPKVSPPPPITYHSPTN